MTKHEAGAVAPSSGRVARPSPPSPEGQDIVERLRRRQLLANRNDADLLESLLRDAADTITRLRTERAALAEPLFAAIAHGDEAHRACLRAALEAFFSGKPIPPPDPSVSRSTDRAGVVEAGTCAGKVCHPTDPYCKYPNCQRLSPPFPSPASEWRTMESAPKDGTRVLLWYTPPSWPAGHKAVTGYWRHYVSCWIVDSYGTDHVQMWQPLPLPPSPGEKTCK